MWGNYAPVGKKGQRCVCNVN